MRKEGDEKNAHLNEDLHLSVDVFSTPADCHARIAHALTELEKFLVPDSVSIIQLLVVLNDEMGMNLTARWASTKC